MFRKGGQSTAIMSGGRRKVHTTFEDGSELVEEYDGKTGELLLRKRRGKSTVGREHEWEYLMGEAPTPWNPEQGLMKESSQNPAFSRQDTRDAFTWRIRNLPYPSDVYQVSVDEGERKLVVRTTNKKYFKRWGVPELDLLGLPLTPGALSWTHAHNTLVVAYAKPGAVLEEEANELEDNKRLRPKEDGDVDCKQQ